MASPYPVLIAVALVALAGLKGAQGATGATTAAGSMAMTTMGQGMTKKINCTSNTDCASMEKMTCQDGWCKCMAGYMKSATGMCMVMATTAGARVMTTAMDNMVTTAEMTSTDSDSSGINLSCSLPTLLLCLSLLLPPLLPRM